MPTDPAGDVTLTHLSGAALPLDDWLTTFHLCVVVLDPYEYESAWLLDTAGRILDVFRQADVRVGFVVTADPADARQFVGPWADSLFVLCDPEKAFVRSLQLETLPALVHLGIDGTLLFDGFTFRCARYEKYDRYLADWVAVARDESGHGRAAVEARCRS